MRNKQKRVKFHAKIKSFDMLDQQPVQFSKAGKGALRPAV